MFTYSLVSDMHLDHPQPKTPSLEQVVIVAGDCGNGLLGLKWLNKLKRKGHTVFAIDGNHEHYANEAQGRTMAETEAAFFRGLEQDHTLDIGGVRILGINGWYIVEDERHWLSYMNDGRFVGSADEVNRQARRDMLFLNEQLCMLPKGMKAIVVTHTAPCYDSLDPKFLGSSGNPYYVNPLMTELMTMHAQVIEVWHHGHTHASVDVHAHGVHIVTNPRGYPRENPEWTPITCSV